MTDEENELIRQILLKPAQSVVLNERYELSSEYLVLLQESLQPGI